MAQAISCSNVRGVFPVHERFWFCLVQVSTTQFCCVPSFLMARVSDGTNVPISPAPASSSKMGSPNGSLPDLEGPGFRASWMDEKINEIYLQLPLFIQNAARIENCVQTLAQTVAAQTTKIPNIEQIVGNLWAHVTSLETNAASGSSGPDSTRSLGICLDRVPAPQPLGLSGPMAQDHLMTTKTPDEDLILPQPVLMNMRQVPSYYDSRANNTTKGLQSGSMLGSTSVRLVFESRAKCQDFVVRYKDNGPPMRLTVPFATPKQLLMSANLRQLKTEKLEKQFAPLWRELADQLEILFPNSDDEGAFIIPALDARSHILSIKDRRNGVGKPVFKLAPGSGQTFALVTPELSVRGVSPEVLQRVLSQANTA